jgi:hypothetical protein
MGSRELKQHCGLDDATQELLKFAMTDLNLSARAYDRILKVARTITDLAGAGKIPPTTWAKPFNSARSTGRSGGDSRARHHGAMDLHAICMHAPSAPAGARFDGPSLFGGYGIFETALAMRSAGHTGFHSPRSIPAIIAYTYRLRINFMQPAVRIGVCGQPH